MGKNSGQRAAVEAAEIQAQAAEQAARTASAGATTAAGISAGAALEAAQMSTEAATYAAQLQHEATMAGVEEMRRQYNQTVTRLQPYVDLGQNSIGDMEQAATVEGLDQRIGQILNTEVFGNLFNERMGTVEDYLSRTGQRRSGAAMQEAATVPTDLALGIEGQLYGRTANNVNIGQSAAAMVGNAGANYAANSANLMQQGAAAQGNFITQGANAGANGILAAGNASAQGINSAAIYGAQGIQGAANAQAQGIYNAQQAKAQGTQNLVNTAIGVAGLFMSDERMKTNMEKVGEIKGLPLYEWDWRDDVAHMTGAEMSIGFKAQDVAKRFPEFVRTIAGVLVIDYPALLDELEAA